MNQRILYDIIDSELLDSQPDEWGVIVHSVNPRSMGFATTLTPAVISQAVANHIDLLVTHHDSWEFMLEERHACIGLLAQYHISHIWCHAPLDAADFGTASALLTTIGCKIIQTIAKRDGRIGELPEPLQLSEVIKLLSAQLSESPCRVHDANRRVARIACISGAGTKIEYLSEALSYGIDLYVTGETNLYLLEFASFRNVSVLIYSHNYTEILGTQDLAYKVADQMGIKKIIRLIEPHY